MSLTAFTNYPPHSVFILPDVLLFQYMLSWFILVFSNSKLVSSLSKLCNSHYQLCQLSKHTRSQHTESRNELSLIFFCSSSVPSDVRGHSCTTTLGFKYLVIFYFIRSYLIEIDFILFVFISVH
jgi:hypothetical protein